MKLSRLHTATVGRYHKDTIDTVTKQQSVTVASILKKRTSVGTQHMAKCKQYRIEKDSLQ